MCRSKRCCVSFVLALLLSSVSLVPCFAETVTGEDIVVNTDGTFCTVRCWHVLGGAGFDFSAPVNTLLIGDTGYDTISSSSFPVVPVLDNLSSFILENDVTLYWRIAPFLYLNDGDTYGLGHFDNIRDYLPKLYYGAGYNGMNTSDNPTTEGVVTGLSIGDASYGHSYSRLYRATLPAKTASGNYVESFSIQYPGFDDSDPNGNKAHWFSKNRVGSLFIHIDVFQVVHTTNAGILGVLDNILAECEEMNVNLNNILSALDNILTQLQALNADTDTIISMLNTLTGLSQSQLTQLENISSSVDAIYYLLTEELKSESEELTGEASAIGGAIENNQYAEDYFQTSMQSSYDSLDLENFSFAGLSGSMQLVGTVFSDMWAAFGEYTILFTYPLVLGIALLVIGRISKHGGGNSSRDSEHKGGEGGA